MKQIRFDRYNRPGAVEVQFSEQAIDSDHRWNNPTGPFETILDRPRDLLVTVFRRYWAAALILVMVAVHAAVIGYLRSRVADVGDVASTSVELGAFRFQPVGDLSRVYQFDLHAVVDPSRRHHAEERLTQMKMEIHESSEQMLRQVDGQWLTDPAQAQIRRRLMEVVQKHLDEALVQRVLITNWLELPIEGLGVPGEFVAKQ